MTLIDIKQAALLDGAACKFVVINIENIMMLEWVLAY